MSPLPEWTCRSEVPWGGVGVHGQRVGDRVLVAVAEGSYGAFDSEFTTIADPYLRALTGWLDAGASWELVAERTRAFLQELQRGLMGPFDEGSPSLQVLAVLAEPRSASVWWTGGSLAQLVRNTEVIASTKPELRGHDVPDADWAPMHFKMMLKELGTPEKVQGQTCLMEVDPGDTLVVLDHLALRGAGWFTPPATWPNPLTVESLVARTRQAQDELNEAEARERSRPFAGAFAVLSW